MKPVKIVLLVAATVIIAAIIASIVFNPKEKTEEREVVLNGNATENYILGNEEKTLQVGAFNASTLGITPELFIIEDKEFGFVISYVWRQSGSFVPIPISIARPSPRAPQEIQSGVVMISGSPYKVYRVISANKESISYVVYAGGNIAPRVETFRTDYSLPLRSTK